MKQSLLILLLCVAGGCNPQPEPNALSGSIDPVDVIDQTHGFLGLTFDSIDEVPLVVTDCVPGSGAEAANIRRNDRLLSLNGQNNPSFATLHKIVADTKPGDSVVAVFERNEDQYTTEFELMSYAAIQSAMEAVRAEQLAAEKAHAMQANDNK